MSRTKIVCYTATQRVRSACCVRVTLQVVLYEAGVAGRLASAGPRAVRNDLPPELPCTCASLVLVRPCAPRHTHTHSCTVTRTHPHTHSLRPLLVSYFLAGLLLCCFVLFLLVLRLQHAASGCYVFHFNVDPVIE